VGVGVGVADSSLGVGVVGMSVLEALIVRWIQQS
jgi:hypothetical protein